MIQDRVLMAVKLYNWRCLHTLRHGWYFNSFCNQLMGIYKYDSTWYCHMPYKFIWGLAYQIEKNNFRMASQLVFSLKWEVTADFYAKLSYVLVVIPSQAGDIHLTLVR